MLYAALMPASILAEEVLPIRIIITANYQHQILMHNPAENRTSESSLQQVATYIDAHRNDSTQRTYAINFGNRCSRIYRSVAMHYPLFELIDSLVGFKSKQHLPSEMRTIIESPKIARAIDSLQTREFQNKFLVIKSHRDNISITYLSSADYPPARNFDTIYRLTRNHLTRRYPTLCHEPHSATEILSGRTDFFNSVHRFQLESADADISLIAANSFCDTISAEIDFRSLNRLYPYDNQLVRFRVTGTELLNILRNNLRGIYLRMQSVDDDLLRLSNEGHTLRAAHNIDCVGGIFWSIDLRRKEFSIKIDSLLNGQPFEPNRIYTIATNSFRANKIIAESKLNTTVEIISQDWFISYLTYLQSAATHDATHSVGRLTLKPEHWTQNALKREIPFILRHQNHHRRQKRSSPLPSQ